MKNSTSRGFAYAISALLSFAKLISPTNSDAAGVTVLTHGLNGNADGWVTGMANEIPKYYKFLGTNYTFYKLYFNFNNGYFRNEILFTSLHKAN